MAFHSSAQLRQMNRNLIRDTMPARDFWTKETLAAGTGLSQATCHNILMEMLETGEVLELSLAASEGGRPARRFRYNLDYRLFAFIWLYSQYRQKSILIQITDVLGRPVRQEKIDVDAVPLSKLLDTMATVLNDYPRVCALGFSYQGVVLKGKTGRWSVMEELSGLDLSAAIRKRFPLPVVIENDVNLAAWGYLKTHSKETDCLAYLAFPKANLFGCGLISDGQLLRGSRGFAGEILYIRNRSWEEQRELLAKPGGKVELVLQLIRPITALLDPERIVIAGEDISPDDIRQIREQCRLMFRSDFLPELHFLPDYSTDNFNGLLDLVRRESHQTSLRKNID